MGLAGGDNRRNIEAIALLALFLSFSSFSFVNLVTRPIACFPGDIGTTKCPLNAGTHDATSLGTWVNMPLAETELMGNMSYRTVLTPTSGGFAGISAILVADCVTSSKTVGAKLTLQYALFSPLANTNTTNFQSTPAVVFVDAGTVPTCLQSGSVNPAVSVGIASLNSTSGGGYVFRVVGSGGGGAGDNPRFSFIAVELSQSQAPLITPNYVSIGTTSFVYRLFVAIPNTGLSVTSQWMATNVSSAGTCGVSGATTDHCWEAGSTICTFAVGSYFCGSVTVSFATAFTGTVGVTLTTRIYSQAIFSTPLGTLSFLQAQTLTV